MPSITLNSVDFIKPDRPVVESAELIAAEASRLLSSGASVILSVRGVRGVSSSFFNVILSAVAESLGNDFSESRFEVDTETATQRMVLQRSWDAFFPPKKKTG
jgi:hypothetical protein